MAKRHFLLLAALYAFLTPLGTNHLPVWKLSNHEAAQWPAHAEQRKILLVVLTLRTLLFWDGRTEINCIFCYRIYLALATGISLRLLCFCDVIYSMCTGFFTWWCLKYFWFIYNIPYWLLFISDDIHYKVIIQLKLPYIIKWRMPIIGTSLKNNWRLRQVGDLVLILIKNYLIDSKLQILFKTWVNVCKCILSILLKYIL